MINYVFPGTLAISRIIGADQKSKNKKSPQNFLSLRKENATKINSKFVCKQIWFLEFGVLHS